MRFLIAGSVVMSESLTNPSRGASVRSRRECTSTRAGDIAAALELARRQGATLFELRAALDDFELRGEPARAAVRRKHP